LSWSAQRQQEEPCLENWPEAGEYSDQSQSAASGNGNAEHSP